MHLFFYIAGFLGSLALVLRGSVLLSRALGGLRPQFNIPDQFVGFITVPGADSPEISAAVISMISGQNDVAVDVLFGSNLINLASLLGLTAVIAEGIFVQRESVLLAGTAGILITAAALVLGDAPPVLVFSVVLVLLIPYVLLLGRGQRALEHYPCRRNGSISYFRR